MESVEILNERLLKNYGKVEHLVQWRIVYSEDQFEKRFTDYTNEGFQLLFPVVREMPKYRQWITNKYILERVMPVSDIDAQQLLGKYSYEPVWVFEDAKGNALPPKWEAITLVISSVYQASARAVGRRYIDPDENSEEALELKRLRIARIQEELFGNETEVGDALAHKQAIVVPRSYES